HMGRLWADPGFLALISKTSAAGHGAAVGPLKEGEAAVKSTASPAPTSGKKPSAAGPGDGKPAPAKVDLGEPTVKPRRTRITTITVAGRKLDLWGLLDKDNAVAQSGGKPPLDLLTSINRAAGELWKMNDTTLLERVPLWRKAVADVRGTAAKAAGG